MKNFKLLFFLATLIFFIAIGSIFLMPKDKSTDPEALFVVEDISSKILTNRTDDFTSAILVNVDEDRTEEILITGSGVANLILKRKKDKFASITIDPLIDAEGNTIAASACDLDGDGRDEIFLLNNPSSQKPSLSKLLRYSPDGWKEGVIEVKSLDALALARSVACVDRKGRGRYGLALALENRAPLFLELSEGDRLVDVASEIGLVKASKGRSVLGIPSPKGFTNIYVGNEDGPNHYYVNDGEGLFEEKAKEYGIDDPIYDARGISLIDADGNALPDLIYGNAGGPLMLFHQNTNGTFTEVTPKIMKAMSSVSSVVTGDLNLDGDEDIYLNNIRGYNRSFSKIAGTWKSLDVEVFSEKNMFGLSTLAADLNGNGSYEILNTHGDAGGSPLTLYTIKPKSKWIKYQVLSRSGGLLRGGTVTLRTTSRDQVRVVHSGSGRYGNYDSDLVFGLAAGEAPVSLMVKSPAGRSFTFEPGEILEENRITLPE